MLGVASRWGFSRHPRAISAVAARKAAAAAAVIATETRMVCLVEAGESGSGCIDEVVRNSRTGRKPSRLYRFSNARGVRKPCANAASRFAGGV